MLLEKEQDLKGHESSYNFFTNVVESIKNEDIGSVEFVWMKQVWQIVVTFIVMNVWLKLWRLINIFHTAENS